MGKPRVNEKQFDGKYRGKTEKNSCKGKKKIIEKIKVGIGSLLDPVT